MPEGSSIIKRHRSTRTLPVLMDFTGGLAQHPGQGRRAGAGLDPADSFNNAGRDRHALRRTGSNETTGATPELASIYVMLASEEASYVSGDGCRSRGQTHYLARSQGRIVTPIFRRCPPRSREGASV
jgi:hypothetical protein